MPITFIDSKKRDDDTSDTQVVGKPTGVQQNDVMVLFVACPGIVNHTPPTGWTLIRMVTIGTALSDPKLHVYRKIVTAGEPATYTFKFDRSGDSKVLAILAYRDVNNSAPVNVSADQQNPSNSTTMNGPSITTTAAGCRIIRAYSGFKLNVDEIHHTPPTGFTERIDEETTSRGDTTGLIVADAPQATAGATGTATAKQTESCPSVAITLALQPTVTAPLAPTLVSPSSGAFADLSGAPTFAWTFNKAGDTQSAFAFRRKVGAGAYEYYRTSDNTWQTTEQWNTSTAGTFTFPTGKWANGSTYNWSVATKDSVGTAGPYASDNTLTGNLPPAVSVSAPADPSNTPFPTVVWSYTDPEENPQHAFRVKVFSEAQYNAGGFNPETSTATYDSEERVGTNASLPIGTALSDGTRYRAYVRAQQNLGDLYSPWAFKEFVVALDVAAIPTLTLTPNATEGRVEIAVQGRDNLLSENQSSVETDTSGWQVTSNATLGRASFNPSQHGLWAISMAAIAAGDMNIVTSTGLSGIPIEVGKQYTVIAYFRAATTPRNCNIALMLYGATGNFLEAETPPGSGIPDTTTGWTKITHTVTIVNGSAVTAAVRLRVIGTGAAGEEHYADAISLAPGDSTVWTRGGLSSLTHFYVERSEDGGITWRQFREQTDYGARQRATVYDYEARPNTTMRYRARTESKTSPVVISPRSSDFSVATTSTDWWLKDPLDASLNIRLALDNAPFENTSEEAQAVFAPLGRRLPIVVSDVVQGERFSLRMRFYTQADFEAFERLRATQRTLLLQSDMAQHWYIRFVGERRDSLVDGADRRTRPFRLVSIGAAEVDPP